MPPACHPSEQPAVVSEKDTFSLSDIGTVYSGVVFCVASEDNGGFPAMTVVTKTAVVEPTLSVTDCVHSASSKPGVTMTRTVCLKTETVKDIFSSA